MIRGLFITDLDGTFIDHDTYQPGPSVSAARKLSSRGVHLVFCSSKTVAEQLPIRNSLEIPVTMIVENGSAIYRWDSPTSEILGCQVEQIRHVADEVRRETRVNLRLLGELDIEEVMQVTGLGPADAALAQQRQYSDSIVSPLDDPETVAKLAEAFDTHGLATTMGGRFLGIHGPNAGKGRAVIRLLAHNPVVSGAVGDGPNDAPMLAEVDYPYIIRGKGAVTPGLALPRLVRIDAFGPNGFVKAAENFLLRIEEGEKDGRCSTAGPW
jgi:mannosyl-3-phosphoglycerate phosphatase family protein